MKKIVSILLSTIIFCSLFAVPLSVGAKTINIESSSSADCEEGYRFVEIYKSLCYYYNGERIDNLREERSWYFIWKTKENNILIG